MLLHFAEDKVNNIKNNLPGRKFLFSWIYPLVSVQTTNVSTQTIYDKRMYVIVMNKKFHGFPIYLLHNSKKHTFTLPKNSQYPLTRFQI